MSNLKPSLLLPLLVAFCLASPGGVRAENATKEVKDKAPAKESSVKDAKSAEKLQPVTNPTISDVKKYYDQGNYQAVISAVSKMKPTMMTHYYKGLAHQGANQNYKAAIEYNHVRKHAVNPQLRYNAERALKSIYKQKQRKKTDWYRDKFRKDEYQRYSEPGISSNPTKLYMRKKEREIEQQKMRKIRDRYQPGRVNY